MMTSDQLQPPQPRSSYLAGAGNLMRGSRTSAVLNSIPMLAVGFLLLVTLLLGIFAFAREQSKNNESVRQSVAARQSLYRLLGAIQDAETGERGYLLTQDPMYLEPLNSAVAVTGAELANLTNMAGGEPEQKSVLAGC